MYVACVDREASSDAVVMIGDDRGVILGTLFQIPDSGDCSVSAPIRSLSRSDSEEILSSMGRSLIASFWGYYVAALQYPEQGSAVVLRAPVSPLACLHIERNTLSIFFSYLDDCIDLELASLSINWDSVIAQVVGGDYLTNETAINEVEDIECGQSIECRPNGRLRRSYWDPRSLLGDRAPTTFGEATQAIRHTTDYCVSALSYPHDRILVQLSGGLDSSIVLSSLCRVPRKTSITSVNYYSEGSGDERLFARHMANAVKCRLEERQRNQELDLRRFLDCNRTVRPVLNFSAPDVEPRNSALARELRATAIFDGELGDNVFGSHPRPGTLVECLRQTGAGREFFRFAIDYSILSKQLLWRTLVLARHEALSVSAEPDFSASRELQRVLGEQRGGVALLASNEAQDHHHKMEDRFLHPWLRQSRGISPGSHALLFGLITVTSATYHSPFSGPDGPIRVSPFVSQPLVEVSLRLPAHLHCKYAQDRSVARAAFADVLPQEILGRGLGKGGPGLWAKDAVERNAAFLREFLLDGILAQRRLIDRKKLERVLSPRIAKSSIIVGDIFAKLYIESWLRRWHKTGAKSDA
jgi:asparagine synthase (glutamine-hydrolysing)